MKKIYISLMAIAIMLCFALTVIAAPRPLMTYTGNASTNAWTSIGNWTLNNGSSGHANRIPQNGDSIVIKTGQTAYIGNADFSTNTSTVTLSNVVIIVQKGATLQLGAGTQNVFGNNVYYYGVLVLDNASAFSLESGNGNNAGQLIANTKGNTSSSTSGNNKMTIGGALKFDGNTTYTINSSGKGFVNGPAQATNATSTGANGFMLGSLPVVLVGFDANLTSDNKVNVAWNTQQETNSDHFDIQRSNDGINWQVIATVKASSFSSIPKYYSCQDANPQKGINLYRLKMVDLDANFGFSDIVNVRLNVLGKISLFPNPAVNSVNISLGQAPAGDWTVTIANTSGQVVAQQKMSKEQTTLNIPVGRYPTGNYTVQISDGASSLSTKLLIAHQ